jgi:superfamily II DNA or RNA helicase
MTLKRPYVVWLTATPPFEDVDYFSLDKNYIDLLWEVDYYIPTPAIIKSGKLAPYNDLVQFVELPENASELLREKKVKLENLIVENKENLKTFFSNYLDNYDDKISEDKYISWILSFCNIYLKLNNNRFDLSNFNKLDFKDIVHSISIWIREYKKNNWKEIFILFKNILYEIWYVWKKSKFVKFYSYIDKLEIYNPKKIEAVKKIIDKEKNNLWDRLRCVIISDFLEDIDWLLDCKFILKELLKYKELNPVLVSGQWIWDSNWEIFNTDILEITEDFNKWKIKLLIWTRWILWEWWDSPKVNTLIDLTGISSFMSTNQVRWRAIRLDKQNLWKVANIYDIVTIDKNGILYKDFRRLEKKHNQVYWVNDSWLIVKWIEHIFNKNIIPSIEYNKIMLDRSEKRNYFYKLWWVWKDFKNKEQFILQLNINPLFKFFPKNIWIFAKIYTIFFKYKNIKLKDIWKKSYYDTIISKYIDKFLYSTKKILIDNNTISQNFSYKIIIESAWKYKILWWKNSDDFEIKKFIEIVSQIFSPVLEQKYLFNDELKIINNWQIKKIKYSFPLPSQLSWNKEIRKKWYKYFHKKSIFYWFFIYWEDHLKIYFKYLSKDRKKHLWYSTFISSDIEKIWI